MYDLAVQIDPGTRRVTLRVDDQVVTLTLNRPLERITFIGYGTLNAVTDFGDIQVTRELVRGDNP